MDWFFQIGIKISVTIAHVIPAKAGIQRSEYIRHLHIESLYDDPAG